MEVCISHNCSKRKQQNKRSPQQGSRHWCFIIFYQRNAMLVWGEQEDKHPDSEHSEKSYYGEIKPAVSNSHIQGENLHKQQQAGEKPDKEEQIRFEIVPLIDIKIDS